MRHFLLRFLIFFVSVILISAHTPATEHPLFAQLPSQEEQGIAQYRLGVLFAHKQNWERAHYWWQKAAVLAYGREEPPPPMQRGYKQYQLPQTFWQQHLFQFAGYWFQKAATEYYAKYYRHRRLPRFVPQLSPDLKTNYAKKPQRLPLRQPLILFTDTGSVSLTEVQLTRQGGKTIIGKLTNNSLLPIKKMHLTAHLYDKEGKLFKISPIHGYAGTTLENLTHQRPQRFRMTLAMHEALDNAALISFEVMQVQYDESFYLTEGHVAQHPLMIYDLHLTPPNSQESVSLKISWVNSGRKTIQRIAFQVEPYTTQALKVRGKVRQQSKLWLEQKGPFPFGHHTFEHLWKHVWFHQEIICVRMTAIEIEFQDRSRFRAIRRRPPQHYFYPNTYPRCTYEEQTTE